MAHLSLIFMSTGECQRKKTSPSFGGTLSVQRSPVFKRDMLISMPFFYSLVLHRKLWTMFNFPYSLDQDSDSSPTTNIIFPT